MYAITFDLDTQTLEQSYGSPSGRNAYADIRNAHYGFDWQQGSVYFGGERINAVTCVLAAIDLVRQLALARGVGARHPDAADRGTQRPGPGHRAGHLSAYQASRR